MSVERQITHGPGGRVLTNCNVWSACGRWVVFDTRSDPAGGVFNGTRIEAVHADSGEVRTLYESRNGACCGVATWHPTDPKVAFILGPEFPTAEYGYGVSRRRGVVVSADLFPQATGLPRHEGGRVQFAPPFVSRQTGHRPVPAPLDARDLVPPFTPGALRGGTHVHVWHPRGDWLSFTYDDDVIPSPTARNVGVCFPRPVSVPNPQPRNHGGDYFSVLVTDAGAGGMLRACEDAWVGDRRALAFLGTVGGQTDAHIAELPDDLTRPGHGPLEGTVTARPFPPAGVTVRRLTTCGVGGPRFWPRSNPAGTRIGFLRPDALGVVQLWCVNPDGGEPTPLTAGRQPVESSFTWHPDGERVACVVGGRVVLVNATTGDVQTLTEPHPHPPRPEACVVSPDGSRLAFVRHLPHAGSSYNQICTVRVPG